MIALVGAATAAAQQHRLDLGVAGIEARIGGDRVRSSGAVIDADQGLVVTTAHTVWGATSLRVATGLGVVYGRLVARAPCDDLALVETQPRLPGLVAIPAAPDPPADGLLTAIGRRRADPQLGTFSLLAIPVGVTPATRARIDPRLRPLADAMRIDASLVPEASGGPIVDRDGRIVAIAHAAATAAGMPWETVRARLAELRRGPRRVYVGWQDQYRCAARMHAYARAEHPGFEPDDARLNAPVPASRLPGTGD
jgi:S1-C subfamily serine protease